MKNYRIADRYARVLIKQAESGKQLEKISQDVAHILHWLKESKEFADFLTNPIVSVSTRQVIIEKLFKHKVDSASYKFLMFIAQKKRLNELPKICEIFQKLYDELQNIVRVQLTSVCSLRQDQITVISNKLKHFFKKDDVQIETHLDESLLGGFKVQVNDLIYDFSVRAQLEKFHEAVLNA